VLEIGNKKVTVTFEVTVTCLAITLYSQLILLALFLLDLLCLLEGLTRDELGHVNSFAVEQIFNCQNLNAGA
jgi:hypothetical protein